MANPRRARKPAGPRIGEKIRAKEVRLVGADGEQVGIVSIDKALDLADQAELDLVEIAPDAKPPVCRILNYSKHRYEQEQKQKAIRKNQKKTQVHQIKLRVKIAEGDFKTKRGHVERFLRKGDKVKLTIMFRGREQTHPELGEKLLLRVADELFDLAQIEQRPNKEGRDMTMVLAPRPEQIKIAQPLASDSAGSVDGPNAVSGEEPLAQAA